MGGTVVKWLVEPGTEVQAGDGVVVLEAMKMETTVQAHRDGTVGEQAASAGDAVAPGTVLTTISAS
jgi:acetyl-CoA/propionyl-CoA carboxylase biotin carboxyl carrier protein